MMAMGRCRCKTWYCEYIYIYTYIHIYIHTYSYTLPNSQGKTLQTKLDSKTASAGGGDACAQPWRVSAQYRNDVPGLNILPIGLLLCVILRNVSTISCLVRLYPFVSLRSTWAAWWVDISRGTSGQRHSRPRWREPGKEQNMYTRISRQIFKRNLLPFPRRLVFSRSF
jgi:hypothetical protein